MLRNAALVVSLLVASVSFAEVFFVDLDDLPVEDFVELRDGPFQASFLVGPPCEELPPGIWGPPCIMVYGSQFGESDEGGVGRWSLGRAIPIDMTFNSGGVIAGFQLLNPEADPNQFRWESLGDWSHDPNRPTGYLATASTNAAGETFYGWVKLTYNSNPRVGEASLILHSFAYSTVPCRPIRAGDRGCDCVDVDGDCDTDLTDLALILSNFGGTTTTGDANLDGRVDLDDLAEALAAFGCRS